MDWRMRKLQSSPHVPTPFSESHTLPLPLNTPSSPQSPPLTKRMRLTPTSRRRLLVLTSIVPPPRRKRVCSLADMPSIPSPTRRSQSGLVTTSSAPTEPAPSWPSQPTTSVTSNSQRNSDWKSSGSSNPLQRRMTRNYRGNRHTRDRAPTSTAANSTDSKPTRPRRLSRRNWPKSPQVDPRSRTNFAIGYSRANDTGGSQFQSTSPWILPRA
mmetsp:Transcript_17253/g.36399  ORF Transcript_17253/g.36399 Transcript_17253/m.36399 type:complete len:212 (+) Transcript_17253:1142-1777(+)